MPQNLSPTNTNAIYGLSDKTGNVILVDPNQINSGPDHKGNELPPLEEMTPYVELYCVKRTDTVITLGENGQYDVESLGTASKVNLLNFDIKTNQNTTLYTEDLIGSNKRVNNEGFGIDSIDITMGANYNPLVTISFKDIRGATLFSGGDQSPLAVIFSFPPPLYKLKIKGAYGRFVEYDLHLVDHNSASTDSNGDYNIKCKFVGHYFGPLADMLLGYIKAAPFIRGEKKSVEISDTSTSTVGGESTKVNSFYELVHRGELLYTAVDTYVAHGSKIEETKAITTVNQQIENIKKALTTLGDKNNLDFAAYMKKQNREAWTARIDITPSIQGTNGTTYSFKRDGLELPVNAVSPLGVAVPVVVKLTPEKELSTLIEKYIVGTVRALQKNSPLIGPETKQPTKITYEDGHNIKYYKTDNPNEDFHFTIDYTGLFLNLDTIVNNNSVSKQGIMSEMEQQLHKITDQTLGLAPTIGNVFEVICKDFDYMMDSIRKAGDKTGIVSPLVSKLSPEDQYKVNGTASWPYVQESIEIKGPGSTANGQPKRQTVLIYPGKNSEFQSWPEVQLVEAYCKSITEQQQADQAYSTFAKALDPTNYIPISPVEAYGQAIPFTNPYIESASSLPDLYTMILERYAVSKNYTYGQIFDIRPELGYGNATHFFKSTATFTDNQRKDLVRMQARLEAHNVAYVVQGNELIKTALMQSTNVTLPTILNYVSQGKSEYLKSKGRKFDRFTFRNTTLYRRGSSGFNGITDIVNKNNKELSSFFELKTTDKNSTVDADREKLLTELSQTLLFGDTSGRKASLNRANTLFYQDSKAVNGGGKSDFINDGADLWLFKLKFQARGIPRADYDFYQLIATSALINTSNGLFNTTFSKVNYSDNVNIAKQDFFNRLNDFDVLINLYDGILSGHSDVLAKFLTPGVIEMPRIYAMHLGYLFSENAKRINATNNVLEDLKIKTQLSTAIDFVSPQDRQKFISYYQDSSAYDFEEFLTQLKGLWVEMRPFIEDDGTLKTKADPADFVLQLTKKVKEMNAITKLIEPVYVVNNSSMTFLKASLIPANQEGIFSILDNKGEVDDNTIQFYLDAFHSELRTLLVETDKANNSASQDALGKIQDLDFKANVYYNFKTLYDRWVVGTQGYKQGDLFERFQFITRSHQNIAQDCIVDFHSLIDDARNPEMSVFSAIGRLLQTNNFMFYPLPSFMAYEGNGEKFDNWRKSWQIDNHLTEGNISRPAFVCMYMGGYSSQAESKSTDSFGDDGFTFTGALPEDFSSGNAPMYAFIARIGGQNQSIFSFPEWNMEEFKATDVGLKMESQLLDKPGNSEKTRKSQNLMNVYQQRSYTVGMSIPLGNMCIQPTQYFQLEGVPFLNGAYMISEVSHSISATTNKLLTKFKGYRMTRFQHRIMTEYLMSYTGLSSEATSALNNYDSNPANAAPSNGGGNSKKLTDQQILELCRVFKYDYNMIKAFIKVESDGGGYDHLGRLKIQFEPKYFFKYTGKKIINGVEGVTAEQKAYNEAAAIDLHAAKLSTSWGMGQIMGANFKAAGHPSVESMVTAFEVSEYNQLYGMLSFIKSDPRLSRAILNLDFPNIAKYYNGAGYAIHHYDVRLSEQYAYYKSRPMPQPNGMFNFAAGDKVFKMVRQTYSDKSTIGGLSLDGQFLCYVLEDKVRPKGEPIIRDQTAIQSGLYPLDITLSNKFKREMPEITHVPNQRGIRMHQGSTADDSSGCLILGSRQSPDRVSGSLEAYNKVFAIMKEIKGRNDGKMYIQIQDTPHA